MIDQRYIRYFDWIGFILILSLLSIGLLFVFSATYRPSNPLSLFFKKQTLGAISGLAIYFFFCFKNLKNLSRIGFFTYFIILALLVYTIASGWMGMGARRWISLYLFRFQPSELAKLFFPVFIAYYFVEQDTPKYHIHKQQLSIKVVWFPMFVLFTSFLLILKQPDLGTALLLLLSGFVLLWFIGIDHKFFIALSLITLLGAPVAWTVLKPYQKQRIFVLFGYGDIKKERYQVEQSKIAIGSGGLTGKGLLNGTQNKLEFLPEDHTDFIFSVICEEWGFVGALIVLLLFSLLFSRLLYIIFATASFFDQIVGIGLLIHIMLSVCINIGMVVGILPIVGLPLPLFSYGLSNLWVTMASLGWLNNIAIRRHSL